MAFTDVLKERFFAKVKKTILKEAKAAVYEECAKIAEYHRLKCTNLCWGGGDCGAKIAEEIKRLGLK